MRSVIFVVVALLSGCGSLPSAEVEARRAFYDLTAPVCERCWAEHQDPPLAEEQLALRLRGLQREREDLEAAEADLAK